MFRATELKTGYANLLGWRQDYDPDKEIGAGLIVTESGQYYQDIHPLLTLDNIRAIAPDFSEITTPNYDFDTWLANKTMASNLNALQSIYAEKIGEKTARNLLYQKLLFDGTGRINDTIANTDKLVGIEIVPIRSKGGTLKIEKIGMQFKGTGTMNVYIFHSSRKEPIETIEIVRTRDGGMQWFDQTDLFLPYLSDDIDSGGSWYLCYDQANLPEGMEAVNKMRDWSKKPCSTCNDYDTQSYRAWSRYLEVHPFKNDSLDGTIELWEIDDNLYTYETNYGINLQVSVECDVTDIFLENKRTFQTVIGLQMAADMLMEFAYNPNYQITRSTQALSKNELLYELNGNEGSFHNSVSYKLKKAIKAVKIDMTNMSRVCYPCSNGGIKYRTT